MTFTRAYSKIIYQISEIQTSDNSSALFEQPRSTFLNRFLDNLLPPTSYKATLIQFVIKIIFFPYYALNSNIQEGLILQSQFYFHFHFLISGSNYYPIICLVSWNRPMKQCFRKTVTITNAKNNNNNELHK